MHRQNQNGQNNFKNELLDTNPSHISCQLHEPTWDRQATLNLICGHLSSCPTSFAIHTYTHSRLQ